jgi:hypothetical protein
MMRVVPAPEPPHFERLVRSPGLRAIAELVGETPDPTRRGPRRRKVADRREAIPSEAFPPFWREVLPDLITAYRRICGYTCLYIERITGGASVDHMVPKARAWDRVYEWDNYRLVCALMNSRKKEAENVLDPFEVSDDWFALELFSYQIVPGPGAVGEVRERVATTLRLLGLNDEICRKARQEYADCYLAGEIRLDHLERRAPLDCTGASPAGRTARGRFLMLRQVAAVLDEPN